MTPTLAADVEVRLIGSSDFALDASRAAYTSSHSGLLRPLHHAARCIAHCLVFHAHLRSSFTAVLIAILFLVLCFSLFRLDMSQSSCINHCKNFSFIPHLVVCHWSSAQGRTCA